MGHLAQTPVLGHISTFGGHPLSCVAAAATVQVLQDENILLEVEAKAKHAAEKLRQHPLVQEVRHLGLMMAVQTESYAVVRKVIDHALARQPEALLTDWFLYCDSAFRFAPPLTISWQELNLALDILIEALDAAQQ
jgi:acetylornithine/succinyldiaminopimelate/putrescine aminotransferase